MTKKRRIALACVVTNVFPGIALWNAGLAARPVLVFKGFAAPGTNGVCVAKFELQNRTRTPIWLFDLAYLGVYGCPFFERQLATETNAALISSSCLPHLNAQNTITNDAEVLPGRCVSLEYPFAFGKPPTQIGVCYYTGNFKNADEFRVHLLWQSVTRLRPPLTFEAKLKRHWENLSHRFKQPKPHELWCSEPISFSVTMDGMDPQKGKPR